MEDLQINMTQEEAERIMRKRKTDGLGKILGKLFFQNTIKAITGDGTTFVNHDKLIDKGFNLPEEELFDFVWYRQTYYWIRYNMYEYLFYSIQLEYLTKILLDKLRKACHYELARNYESKLPDGAPKLPFELAGCSLEQVFEDCSDSRLYIRNIKSDFYSVRAYNETIGLFAEQAELPELNYYQIEMDTAEALASTFDVTVRTLKEFYQSDPGTLKRIDEYFPLIKQHKIKVPESSIDEIRSLVEEPDVIIRGEYDKINNAFSVPDFDD